MNNKEYVKKAKRTLSTKDDFVEHMIIGLCTESAELLDAYKKHKFYGRDLDTKNMKEEIGDICWYMYQLADSFRIELDNKLASFNVENIRDILVALNFDSAGLSLFFAIHFKSDIHSFEKYTLKCLNLIHDELLAICEHIGYSLDEAKADNIKKLSKRYPDKFEDVVDRDYDKELAHIRGF